MATEKPNYNWTNKVDGQDDILAEDVNTLAAMAQSGIDLGHEANGKFDDLSITLGHKADKATTISGYGITDAYTKTEIDASLQIVYNAMNQLNVILSAKANAVDVYTKEEVDLLVSSAIEDAFSKFLNVSEVGQ